MSLRDQLLAKGLVSKKKAREHDREARKERRKDKGRRDRKAEAEARAQAEAEARRQREQEALLAARAERRAERDEAERVLQIRNLIVGNRIATRAGEVIFHHRRLGSDHLRRVALTAPLARKLQAGELSIAALQEGSSVRYELVVQRGATKLAELAPEVLVHHLAGHVSPSAADLVFSPRDWPPDLAARRLT